MKKLLTITAIAGLALAAYSQGSVDLQNQGGGINGAIDLNTDGTLSLATSFTVALYYGDVGGAAVTTPLANADQYGQLTYAGFEADSSELAATPALTANELAGNPGLFNGGVATLGISGSYSGGAYTSSDVLVLAAWSGTYATLAQAVAANAEVGFLTFINPVGPGGSDPHVPLLTGWQALTPTPAAVAFEGGLGYPDLVMSPVPEPTTLALAALGGAAMLLIRRKK